MFAVQFAAGSSGMNFSTAAAIEHGSVQTAVAGPPGHCLQIERPGSDSRLPVRGERQTLGRKRSIHRIDHAIRLAASESRTRAKNRRGHEPESKVASPDAALYLGAVRDILPVLSE